MNPRRDEIIQEALKTFTNGFTKNAELIKKIRTSNLFASYRGHRHNGSNIISGYPQPQDDFFSYNANRIKDSLLIAAQGPDFHCMSSFIANTVYNPKLPIHDVVALGFRLTREKQSANYDFYDYCLESRSEIFGQLEDDYQYEVSIKQISGTFAKTFSGTMTWPDKIVQSVLTIQKTDVEDQKEEKLSVTSIRLAESTALDLQGNQQEIIWQLFKKSLTTPILIHCNDGVGSTGHLILLFEILKNYETIFSKPAIAAAKEIHNILNRIRENRPALVLTEEHFSGAIRNADILHHYALNKGYLKNIEKPLVLSQTSVGFFPPEKKSQVSESDDWTLVERELCESINAAI